MNYYVLDQKDQPKSSWVLFDVIKPSRVKTRSAKLPQVIYRFFGPDPAGETRMKPEYISICCKKCGRYDDDDVFEVGFREPVTIRIKGDFGHTEDRQFIVSEKFVKVLQEAKVAGYETKPIGKSAWYALRATLRVDFDPKVIKPAKPFCPECKRSNGTTGMFRYQRQLVVPSESNTIFTTKIGWPSLLWDREIFLTEDVAVTLKKGGIKGGYCNRLFSDVEAKEAELKRKQGPQFRYWKPPRSTIFL